MIKADKTIDQKVINRFIKSKQDHLFTFWEELGKSERDSLLSDLKQINLNEIFSYFKLYKNQKVKKSDLSEAEYFSIYEKSDNETLKKTGIKIIKEGKVAFLTVAGGQGSRLGYDHPKGFFPISPVKQKSLFQIFAEKIKFYSGYYQTTFKWFIMTSILNYDEIINYFKKNNFFDLGMENIFFFKQGVFPSITPDGKLTLENKSSIFTNPDGHGGVVKALIKNDMIKVMKSLKTSILMYFQVDNPLVRLIDPYFIGYHFLTKSLVSSKVIKKEYPEEKLGAIGKINGKNNVIEYSDLSKEDIYAKDEKGVLKYLMGSIAIHLFDINFLSKFSKKMPIHFALKKIKAFDFKKNPPEIAEIEGIKFEKFVFDTIPAAKKSVFYETLREDEFFPLKNKNGIDSIETCIEGQSKLFFKWLRMAGFIKSEYNKEKIEISPMFASDLDSFLEKAVNKKEYIINAIYERDESLKNEIYIE